MRQKKTENRARRQPRKYKNYKRSYISQDRDQDYEMHDKGK